MSCNNSNYITDNNRFDNNLNTHYKEQNLEVSLKSAGSASQFLSTYIGHKTEKLIEQGVGQERTDLLVSLVPWVT